MTSELFNFSRTPANNVFHPNHAPVAARAAEFGRYKKAIVPKVDMISARHRYIQNELAQEP